MFTLYTPSLMFIVPFASTYVQAETREWSARKQRGSGQKAQEVTYTSENGATRELLSTPAEEQSARMCSFAKATAIWP